MVVYAKCGPMSPRIRPFESPTNASGISGQVELSCSQGQTLGAQRAQKVQDPFGRVWYIIIRHLRIWNIRNIRAWYMVQYKSVHLLIWNIRAWYSIVLEFDPNRQRLLGHTVGVLPLCVGGPFEELCGGYRASLEAKCGVVLAYVSWGYDTSSYELGPNDHINIERLDSGSKAQDSENSRNPGVQDPCL